ncbi:MAG: sigma-70 family RNA polymerase sigma factor [Candidatus Pacebacteria bacterium]|nr:sigma-70 family RNA polymerase sigma factor [Candidatus Paceibacterota bacterium]
MNTRVKDRFVQIHTEHADSIFRFCFLRVSDRNVAIDLTQDVFMRYWDNLIKGNNIQNDKAFLFTVARNIIIDWYRKKKSISLDALQEENDDPEEFALIEDNAKGALELSTESRFLLDKIKSLPHTSQQVLYFKYIEDLKPKEIAEILHIKENAVSVRIFRALEDLRKLTGYDIPPQ